jgi:hypothetical protein
MTADARRTPRRGTPSGMRDLSVCTRRTHERSSPAHTRTRPSLGPSTRARQSSLCIRRKSGGGAGGEASRLGKPGEPGGTNTGVFSNGRSAARRVSLLPQGSGVARREQEEGRGLRPCEDQRARVWLPARRIVQLQKSVGDVWSQISSAYALQKERTGSSERGPSSE